MAQPSTKSKCQSRDHNTQISKMGYDDKALKLEDGKKRPKNRDGEMRPKVLGENA